MFDKAKVIIDLEEYNELKKSKKELELEEVLLKLIKVSIILLRQKYYDPMTNQEPKLKEAAFQLGYRLIVDVNTEEKALQDIGMVIEKL